MTLIDIFSDRYEHIGTADKAQAHRDGLWHRTFSALAVNPADRRVFLQKKLPGRCCFDRPDYADVTVGGHFHAGETIPDGVREIHEELGLPVGYEDLRPIGLRQTAITLAPDYIEREFQHWHLLPVELSIEEISLDGNEVGGFVEIDLDDAIKLADGTTTTIPANYATRNGTGVSYTEGSMTREELVPNYLALDQLYLRLFITARRYCTGERTHLFW